jgi:hypothetical protein
MQNLHTYLNDHLAGSVGALELLDHLIAANNDPALQEFLTTLRKEIDEDQSVLQNLLRQTGGEESSMRKAGAWIMEKLSRPKLGVDTADKGLGLFQALEALSLGITGKRSLWRTLAVAESTVTELRGFDYSRLENRAREQFERVEAKGLELAVSVLNAE